MVLMKRIHPLHFASFVLFAAVSLALCGGGAVFAADPVKMYHFRPSWEKDEMAGKFNELPFLLEVRSDRALFILVWEMKGKSAITPYCDTFDMKRRWDDKAVRMKYEGMPLEWHFEPKMITHLAFYVSIFFDPNYAFLKKPAPKGPFYCRLVLPVLELSGKPQVFHEVTSIQSQWFLCEIRGGKVVHLSKVRDHFQPYADFNTTQGPFPHLYAPNLIHF